MGIFWPVRDRTVSDNFNKSRAAPKTKGERKNASQEDGAEAKVSIRSFMATLRTNWVMCILYHRDNGRKEVAKGASSLAFRCAERAPSHTMYSCSASLSLFCALCDAKLQQNESLHPINMPTPRYISPLYQTQIAPFCPIPMGLRLAGLGTRSRAVPVLVVHRTKKGIIS